MDDIAAPRVSPDYPDWLVRPAVPPEGVRKIENGQITFEKLP